MASPSTEKKKEVHQQLFSNHPFPLPSAPCNHNCTFCAEICLLWAFHVSETM
jgi:hypothetical protein